MKAMPIILTSAAVLFGTLSHEMHASEQTTPFVWLDRDEWKGQAEIAQYRGEVLRYRERRPATLTLITVTEPFNMDELVKSTDGQDEILALKQNQVLEYQTGVYPYNQMNSVFWEVSNGDLIRATMSSQEWCGHTFKDVRPEGDHLRMIYNSYWEGEALGSLFADRPEETSGSVTVLYDELPLLVRTDRLQSASRIYLFPMLMSSSVEHPDWDVGHPARQPSYRAGSIEVETTQLVVGGRAYTNVHMITIQWQDIAGTHTDVFYVDMEDENRVLLRWDRNDGTQFELSLLTYTDYWNQNRVGDRLQ